ncbi:MAG: ribose 5-phosphate isomerase B [Ignavibacteria bacterium]|nr:ribose 5-phosphate isomerase B [Ignavibacteria bacterium]
MIIALAADHAGFAYKERIKDLLDGLGHTFIDYGTESAERADYPDYAHRASEGILRGECERGIFVCGTGIGISIAANRHRGIRAASCQILEAARMSRLHNDANVLAIGERLVAWPLAEEMILVWLETPFEGGRHSARIEKIDLRDS